MNFVLENSRWICKLSRDHGNLALTIPPQPRRRSPEPSPRHAQKEDTKLRLLEAAEHWFSEQGYENVSVTEVARTAGVVPSLINTYFGGKAGLLYAVVKRHNAPQFAALEAAVAAGGAPLERLDRIVATMAGMDLQRTRLLAALQGLSWNWPAETEAQNRADLRPLFEAFAAVVRDGIAEGRFRPIVPEEAVEIMWAIYTMGLRPAVFGQARPAECTARIQHWMRLLLLPNPMAEA